MPNEIYNPYTKLDSRGYQGSPYLQQSFIENQFQQDLGGIQNQASGSNPYMGFAQSGMSALTGAVEMGAGIKDRINEFRDMDVRVQGQQFEEGYRPTYNLGDDISKLNNLMEGRQDVGRGMIGQNVMKGLSTGFSAGAATMNPWGMAIGAVAGTVGGLFAGIFGKDKAKDEYNKKVTELGSNIQRRQGQFNVANENFFEGQGAKDIFNLQQERKQNRMYNIPSFNSIY